MNADSKRDERNKYVNRKKEQRRYCIDCGKEISKGATRCCQCSNKFYNHKDIPISRNELKQLIRTIPFVQIGLKFNVTDNAVRKWCIRLNLPKNKKEIKKYSDEQWNDV